MLASARGGGEKPSGQSMRSSHVAPASACFDLGIGQVRTAAIGARKLRAACFAIGACAVTLVRMERSIAIPLGVIVERRALDHAWAKWSWRPAAVLPGAGPVQDWREIERSEKLVRWHAATLQLELHRKETEAYKVNLSSRLPVVYVVLRREEAAGAPPGCEVRPFRVTASPFEAQNFLDSGEDIVEGVPMPESVIAWVQAFVDRHHVDAPFKKRERKRFAPDEAAFGRAPGRLDGQGIKRGPHGRD